MQGSCTTGNIPDPDTTGADTAGRSLAHWSEQGRREMLAFYELATEDYRQLAAAADWPALLAARAHPEWSLLDVACGSGKWPTAIRLHGGLVGTVDEPGSLPPLRYDLLDPSTFSIAEAKAALAPPFVPGAELCMTLQDLPAPAVPYDVVWAVHALYAIPLEELPVAAERFLAALAPGGLGFVVQSTAQSHYLRFYDAYRAGVRAATPFTSSEQVAEALRGAGATVRVQRLSYPVGTDDDTVAEGFLQRCAFDDSTALADMRTAPVLGDYLETCRVDGRWHFQQEADVLWLEGPA